MRELSYTIKENLDLNQFLSNILSYIANESTCSKKFVPSKFCQAKHLW